MSSSSSGRSRVPAPLRISLLYAAFGFAWIALGDALVWLDGGVSLTGLLLGLAKGFLFVVVSATLIFILVRREVARRERAAAELSMVLEAAPVGIVALTAEGRVARWNRGAQSILGWSEDEVLGRAIADLGLAPSEQASTPLAPDTSVQARDGSSVAVRIFSSSEATADGSTVLVFRDRRPRIAMENALRRAHKLEAVGRLAGGVAHEFNNVLTAIIGHAALLQDSLDHGDERRTSVLELRRAAERAALLTRQLLVFSGKHVTRPAAVDLGRMLQDMSGLIRRTIGAEMDLDLQLEENLWTARCDTGQIQQLVVSLVENAREATDGTGTLTLATANVPAHAPRTGPDPLPPGEFVLLRVIDTGRGMSADTLAHAFEPFFTTKEQGTGLGLATVYGIVQQSDGHIRLSSEPGRGTTLEIYLPRGGGGDVDHVEPGALETDPARLLVVEDDDAVRELTCRVLRRAGHDVLSARNGIEALDSLAASAGIRLIVADIVMPGMNGFELGAEVRRTHPDLPILYTSGYVAADAASSTALEPGTYFLEKPYRPNELLARVAALLARAPASS